MEEDERDETKIKLGGSERHQSRIRDREAEAYAETVVRKSLRGGAIDREIESVTIEAR